MKNTFLNGIFKENPTFVLFLGMCPTLAVTTAAINGIGMGLSTMAVLVCSNIFISLLRSFIPEKVRIAAYVVVIASFVTVVEMLMNAYVPALSKSLGLYIPLIVVNCIILGRAEAFASKNGPLKSAFDGLGMGLGFTCALTIIGSIREILGAGSIFGFSLFGESFQPMTIMILPPGAFLTLGIIVMVINIISQKKKKGESKIV
ncbi:MAG: electron transport complex subunit E [Ruminococcaceae bacterium]|nr:electron transport complex subunit E [Oscillospiraceae bacterium]